MKKIQLFTVLFLACAIASAQEIVKDLKPFTKVVASSRINVILTKGDHESIRLVYSSVDKNKINIDVTGKTLRIYLDNARKVEKTIKVYDDERVSRHGIYEGVEITAYVTYRELSSIEVRGTQEITCNGDIESDKFTVRAYGENEIRLSSLKTGYFRASLYGRNNLKILNGKTLEQKYRIFGENKINTEEFHSEYAATNIYGEGRVSINTSEELRITAFGEPNILVTGGGNIHRRLILGRARISNN